MQPKETPSWEMYQSRIRESMRKLEKCLQKPFYRNLQSPNQQPKSAPKSSRKKPPIIEPIPTIDESYVHHMVRLRRIPDELPATQEYDYQSKLYKVPTIYSDFGVVYNLGSFSQTHGVEMKNIGIDIGTKTIVIAYRGANNAINFISEINGYWIFDRATPFIENILNDPTKTRSDGTKRPARWIKLPSTNQICVLGRDAEEFAYAKNDTLLRPMAEGGVSANEESMIVLATLVSGLLEAAEKDLGKFGNELSVCYCTTAEAVNKNINIQYHERVVNLILDNYKTKTKLKTNHIKESHAIVLEMSDSGTGIGISWGAGTVTVSYVKYGIEVYSFCWVGAGDWIDEQVAMRHGYDADPTKMKRASKETPTTVSKRKHTIDLTPGKDPADRVGIDIVLHYDVLISQVVDGIINGFIANENQARIEEGINVYMAGGTSSPNGFESRVQKKFEAKSLPFQINSILKADKPLYTVAQGCLKASEMGL